MQRRWQAVISLRRGYRELDQRQAGTFSERSTQACFIAAALPAAFCSRVFLYWAMLLIA